jgi:hypothetical protein
MKRSHERWPHYPHWHRMQNVFRFAAGRSWRRAAARFVGVRPDKLRATVDTEPPSLDYLRNLDAGLIHVVDATIRRLEDRLEAARNLRKSLVISRNNHGIIPYGPPRVERKISTERRLEYVPGENVIVDLLEEAINA